MRPICCSISDFEESLKVPLAGSTSTSDVFRLDVRVGRKGSTYSESVSPIQGNSNEFGLSEFLVDSRSSTAPVSYRFPPSPSKIQTDSLGHVQPASAPVSGHNTPVIASPSRSFAHSRSLSSSTLQMPPVPIFVPPPRAQKSVIVKSPNDESEIITQPILPLRKTSLGAETEPGDRAGRKGSVASIGSSKRQAIHFDSLPRASVSDLKEVAHLISEGQDALASPQEILHAQEASKWSSTRASQDSSASSLSAFSSGFEPRFRSTTLASDVTSAASATVDNSDTTQSSLFRVSTILSKLDYEIDAESTPSPLPQVQLSEAQRLIPSEQLDALVLEGLRTIAESDPAFILSTDQQVDSLLEKFGKDQAEMQERYRHSRYYRNVLLRRFLLATGRAHLDQGPHVAQLLADAIQQVDMMASEITHVKDQQNRLQVSQADHKTCCASTAMAKLSASYIRCKANNDRLRDEVSNLEERLACSQAALEESEKALKSRKMKKAKSSDDIRARAKSSQEDDAILHITNPALPRSQPASRLPCPPRSLAAEIQRSALDSPAKSEPLSTTRQRSRTASQPSPTAGEKFAQHKSHQYMPVTPASALMFEQPDEKSFPQTPGSSCASSFMGRRTSVASTMAWSAVGLGQLDEFLNLV